MLWRPSILKPNRLNVIIQQNVNRIVLQKALPLLCTEKTLQALSGYQRQEKQKLDANSTNAHSLSWINIEGRWIDDMNVDHATTTDSEGIRWNGTLKNLKPQSFMKVQLPNGQKYNGVWLNGNMQHALSVRNRRNAEPVYHLH